MVWLASENNLIRIISTFRTNDIFCAYLKMDVIEEKLYIIASHVERIQCDTHVDVVLDILKTRVRYPHGPLGGKTWKQH